MLIQVTTDHITKGVRGDSLNCPVARAIAEQCPSLDFDVEPGALFMYRRDPATQAVVEEFELTFPDPVSYRIGEYDHGATIEPFSFELAVEPYLNLACAVPNASKPPSLALDTMEMVLAAAL